MTAEDERRFRLIVKQECEALAAEIIRRLIPLLPTQPEGEGISLTRQMEIRALARQAAKAGN